MLIVCTVSDGVTMLVYLPCACCMLLILCMHVFILCACHAYVVCVYVLLPAFVYWPLIGTWSGAFEFVVWCGVCAFEFIGWYMEWCL